VDGRVRGKIIHKKYLGTKDMNELFLTRHGLIEYESTELNKHGIEFSRKLISLLGNKPIKFIASSTETRCIETITPLAKHLNLDVRTYDKFDFMNLKPLQDSLSHKDSTSVICYRIEEINFILSGLNLAPFTKANRDSSYTKIIHLVIENSLIIYRNEINTGYAKEK
jgi:Histidine phosphatase superfamily (branch 1)